MKYTKIHPDTFKNLVVNAGILLSSFDPSTGTISDSAMLGATTGGITFNAAPEYKDWGEDVDNCPKNTKQLKRIDDWTVTLSGTFVAVTAALARQLSAAADLSTGKITPRDHLDLTNDFKDIWFVCDYSDVNTGSNAGLVAIRVMDALSTGGFQLQTTDKEKGQFSFEFTGHYSLDAADTVPFEIYVLGGSAAPGISITPTRATVTAGSTVTLTASCYPSNSTITWASLDTDVATVSGGVVTGVAAGYCVVKASITVSSTTYTDICTVTVVAASA